MSRAEERFEVMASRKDGALTHLSAISLQVREVKHEKTHWIHSPVSVNFPCAKLCCSYDNLQAELKPFKCTIHLDGRAFATMYEEPCILLASAPPKS